MQQIGNSQLPHPIFLVGFMGAGKSSVARALSDKLCIDWVDVDALVEQNAGCSITEIFANQGEEAFRNLETQALTQAAQFPARIVACGGGIVVRPENVRLMNDAGLVVYLQVDIQQVVERIPDRSTRPLLSNPAQAAQLLEGRIPLYEQAADIVVDTNGRTINEVVSQIMEQIEHYSEDLSGASWLPK